MTGVGSADASAAARLGGRSALPGRAGWSLIALAAAALGLGGCASTPRQAAPPRNGYCVPGYGCYRVLPSAAGFHARGVASWYGVHAAGRPTASGAPFDPNAMRIANKTLPFGTWVKIRNLRNGREAVAMVDDRGPFVDGRILDATPAVARQLGYYIDGTAPVSVSAVPVADLSAAQRQAARDDEQMAVDYARRHPHEILAEAGHVAIRGVIDITSTGVKIGVGIVRIGLEVTYHILKFLL
jgi:rare lipoprotein A